MQSPKKIAMWSGPRNLSTAMMYSFGNRADCAVVDEPFYAAYLAKTGLDHPMRDEVLASQSSDTDAVVACLMGQNPGQKPIYYQKHMTQHMIDEVPRDWMRDVTNVFLIRHPARVIASYAAKRENPTLEDIGFRQQAELFDLVTSWGKKPVVLDSSDLRDAPQEKLEALCDAIGIGYSPNMMSWAKGGHPSDGVWAPHWYGAVWNSETFAGAEGELPMIPDALQPVLEQATPYYENLAAHKI
jgi:hypothetical protein